MTTRSPRNSNCRRHRARGITMVEFVIVFPLATLFVLSLIQFGMVYMAKLTLNHATFMAARIGSLHNAREDEIREALIRGLSPFYQDSTISGDKERLAKAYLESKWRNESLNPFKAEIEILSPSKDTFADFGVKDPKTKATYIPNDNLEWRTLATGAKSKQNIRDANLLKIRVRYGYEMKVPLIGGVISRMMCSGSIGVEAYGNVKPWDALLLFSSPDDCLKYYKRPLSDGKVYMPIESFAIVEMQSRAEQN
ncbi:MAG TPA: TadE/TadG family type IV pilus assembly protein [Ideonella sp.]|uniref:TadE/TadG family type IV pilus assembly protein n=1 Tax=Ideonella sp. TaxID=1929293 RepID=UPI002E366272|nr:TadE/TadG family type IV pilus assembly protein [Ideonella sp.]HEX5684676.1 TadE/TadG family type IV pilus assembly protein [Ideonella sp.]